MMVRRVTGASVRARVRRAGRLIRLLSVLVVSTISLGIVQGAGDSLLEDDPDQDERIVFRHYV